MTRFLSWLLVLVLLGVFAGALGYAVYTRAEAGKGLPAFSVYSEESDGLAETGRWLRRKGWEPVAVTRPIQHTHDRGLLVMVQPQGTALFPGEEPDLPVGDVQGMLRWVEEGNTLLFCCDSTTALHRQLGLGVLSDSREPADARVTVNVDSALPYLAQVERLEVSAVHTLSGSAGVPLWWVKDSPGAVVVPRGKGRVLVVADPSLLTPEYLRREDNSIFLYNVAWLHGRGERVYFDEYHHGLRAGGGFWGYLRYHHLQWVLLPVLVVVLVAVWRAAVRLGRATPTPHEPHADAVDYASAVARIYQRAGARRLLARILNRSFLLPLTRHLHLRRAALPAEILAAWRQRYPKESTERLQTLLRGLAELRKGTVSDRQLLGWTRACDEFTREVASG